MQPILINYLFKCDLLPYNVGQYEIVFSHQNISTIWPVTLTWRYFSYFLRRKHILLHDGAERMGTSDQGKNKRTDGNTQKDNRR